MPLQRPTRDERQAQTMGFVPGGSIIDATKPVGNAMRF